MDPKSQRFYRYHHLGKKGSVSFQARVQETDLWIRAARNLEKEALESIMTCRRQLEQYIALHPLFLHSLSPLPEDVLAPPLLRRMFQAALAASVGPMASVAGAIAEEVGKALKPLSPSIIVENGGDCYLDQEEEITVGIWAGPRSPFSGKMGLRFTGDRFPLAICTSSGTVGHSLSFGKADAATAVARDAALSDAAATALANQVKTPKDIAGALEWAATIPGLEGVLIAVGDQMGAWGNLQLVRL
ncbi:MAG: UPF0280 family protein [Deltaproteobacteria bacterium]|nr:UPF0280 family protein [Deltaproteobacteria bacterium]